MTLSTTQATVTYTGNGVLTAFNVPFKFRSASDIRATLITIATGVGTVLNSSQFSVSGAGSESGGTLTYNPGTPMPATQKLQIDRVLSIVQSSDFMREGALDVENLEAALDSLTMMVQQVEAALAVAAGNGAISSILRNVAGPASSVVGNFASFLNTNGNSLGDSGFDATDFALVNHVHPDLWTQIVKLADFTKVSSTSLSSDPDLTFQMAANTTYLIDLKLFVQALTTPGYKIGITGPSSPTAIMCLGRETDSAPSTTVLGVTSYTTVRTVSPAANREICVELSLRVVNGVNAGAFAVQLAQNVSNASAATLYKGSTLRYRAI